jgi:hypothetical protein
MLLYGSYMNNVRLKWKRLFILSILSCFDPYMLGGGAGISIWGLNMLLGSTHGSLVFCLMIAYLEYS